MTFRSRVIGALIAGLVALVPVCGPAPAAAGEIVFGITSATAFSLPHYIAVEKKYYEVEGVTIDTIVIGSATAVLQQLAAGSLNIGQAATDQALRAIMRGAPLRMFAGAASNAPFRLIGAKTIKTWSDLKGKTISVGGPTDVTLYFLRVMARKNGLADGDYDVIYAGGTPARFAQLASGAVAAAILTNPNDFTALAQGYVDLGSVPRYLPGWAQNNMVVDTRWAAKNRPAILAFLRAHIRATRYFYESANRDEIIAILAKYTKVPTAIASTTYDFYVEQNVVARDSAMSPDGIKINLDALVSLGELKEMPSLDGFIDPSFLAEASKP